VSKWPVSARKLQSGLLYIHTNRHRSPARVYEPTSAYRNCFPESGQAAFRQKKKVMSKLSGPKAYTTHARPGTVHKRLLNTDYRNWFKSTMNKSQPFQICMPSRAG
jgi:hypothetical protein